MGEKSRVWGASIASCIDRKHCTDTNRKITLQVRSHEEVHFNVDCGLSIKRPKGEVLTWCHCKSFAYMDLYFFIKYKICACFVTKTWLLFHLIKPWGKTYVVLIHIEPREASYFCVQENQPTIFHIPQWNYKNCNKIHFISILNKKWKPFL